MLALLSLLNLSGSKVRGSGQYWGSKWRPTYERSSFDCAQLFQTSYNGNDDSGSFWDNEGISRNLPILCASPSCHWNRSKSLGLQQNLFKIGHVVNILLVNVSIIGLGIKNFINLLLKPLLNLRIHSKIVDKDTEYHASTLIAISKELDASIVQDLFCHLRMILRDLNEVVQHIIVVKVLILPLLHNIFAQFLKILNNELV